MLDIATRIAKTGQLLVRSGMEIDRILSAMIDDHAAVTAELPQQLIFISRMLSVDPVKQRVVLAYSDYQAANSALLTARSVTFNCHHRWGKFAFNCAWPRHRLYGTQPAIAMDGPEIVVALEHRQPAVRTPVLAESPDLHCRLRMGLIAFDARLVDMSLDGRAFLLGDPAIPVCAGTRLTGVRITPRGGRSLIADIDIGSVAPAVLPNGERATRIACRIAAPNDVKEQLVRLFIIAIE